MDDPLFIWAAKNIQQHPANPYGFSVNWYYNNVGMWQVTKNPPLTCYYVALVAYLAGWSETALHLAFLIPAVFAVLGTYFLARKLCSRPLLASLITLTMPVFLISSTTIMCDVMMLAFWIWATVLWIRGIEKNEHLALAAASLLIALAALTKYFGMSLLFLLPLYAALKQRKIGSWIIYLIIPISALCWYQLETQALYGRGLILDAIAFAEAFREYYGFGTIIKGVIGLAFIGGCLAGILFYIPFLWSRRSIFIQVAVLIIAVFGASSLRTIGTFHLHDSQGVKWLYIIQFCAAAFIGTNALILSAISAWKRRTDAESVLLFCWVAGTFLFAGFINWSVNGRSMLPMAPAVAILLVRQFDRLNLNLINPRVLFWPLLPAACFALLVTQGDYALAGAGRRAATEISAKYGKVGRSLWFQGHWGFQYYMELKGGRGLEKDRSRLSPGDILVVPKNNCFIFPLSAHITARKLEIVKFPVAALAATMNIDAGAGFYLDLLGPLPFVLGHVPAERYYISAIE